MRILKNLSKRRKNDIGSRFTRFTGMYIKINLLECFTRSIREMFPMECILPSHLRISTLRRMMRNLSLVQEHATQVRIFRAQQSQIAVPYSASETPCALSCFWQPLTVNISYIFACFSCRIIAYLASIILFPSRKLSKALDNEK